MLQVGLMLINNTHLRAGELNTKKIDYLLVPMLYGYEDEFKDKGKWNNDLNLPDVSVESDKDALELYRTLNKLLINKSWYIDIKDNSFCILESNNGKKCIGILDKLFSPLLDNKIKDYISKRLCAFLMGIKIDKSEITENYQHHYLDLKFTDLMDFRPTENDMIFDSFASYIYGNIIYFANNEIYSKIISHDMFRPKLLNFIITLSYNYKNQCYNIRCDRSILENIGLYYDTFIKDYLYRLHTSNTNKELEDKKSFKDECNKYYTDQEKKHTAYIRLSMLADRCLRGKISPIEVINKIKEDKIINEAMDSYQILDTILGSNRMSYLNETLSKKPIVIRKTENKEKEEMSDTNENKKEGIDCTGGFICDIENTTYKDRSSMIESMMIENKFEFPYPKCFVPGVPVFTSSIPTVPNSALKDFQMTMNRATLAHKLFTIKDVKFNGDHVIIFWTDNTKTIVTMQEDESKYDVEKAIFAAFTKKILSMRVGNAKDRSIDEMLAKWTKKFKKEEKLIKAQIKKVKARKEKKATEEGK